jgi:hypothetical protein
MSESTDTMIGDLVGDLPPVERVAPLRRSIVVIVAVTLPIYATWLIGTHFLGIPRPIPSPSDVFTIPSVYWIVAGVLVLSACGGLVAGLVDGIPGRETLARRGRYVAIGAGIAAFATLLGALGFGATTLNQPDSATVSSWMHCGATAAILALIPLVVCMRIVLRGVPVRPQRAIYLTCVGVMGLATAAIHTTCPNLEPLHQLFGHALSPLVAGGVLWLLVRAILGQEIRTVALKP